MSFSDLMSSGRGPGVIGTLMALLVLVGFAALFMFAADEDLQGGGRSIESIILQQGKEITNSTEHLADQQKLLAILPSRIATLKDLDRVRQNTKITQDQIANLNTNVEAGQKEVSREIAKFDEYKDEYRTHVRDKAKGQIMQTLTTKSGIIYNNVNIREVTAIGIQIRHDDGHKRIPFEDLSDEMRDYYQFDSNQKENAVKQEVTARDHHDAAVAASDAVADAQMVIQNELNLKLEKKEIQKQVLLKESQVQSIKSSIQNLQREKSKAASEASSARSSGRTYINKSNTYDSDIRAKQSQIEQMMSEIKQLKSSR
jgi:hypothetical protein